jgi:hypothetical protein
LNQRVARVRRRRRSLRIVSGAAAILLFGYVTQSNWQQPTKPDGMPGSVQESLVADAVGADAVPAPRSKPLKSRPPRVQLYASVSQSVPVFDFDQQTQSMHHIGWVESQQEVPVDMNYVPDNQQDSFKAVLNNDNDAWYFSL